MGSHSRSDERDSKKHSRSSHRDDHDSKRHRSSKDEGNSSSRDKDRHKGSSSSSRSDRDRDRERRGHSSSSKRRHDVSKGDEDDDDEWVEKAPSPGAQQQKEEPSRPPVDTVGTFEVGSMPTAASLRRLEGEDLTDGFGEGDVGGSSSRGGGLFGLPGDGKAGQSDADFFGSFGTERRRKEPKEKVDPTVRLILSVYICDRIDFACPAANDGPVVARAEQGLLARSAQSCRCLVRRCSSDAFDRLARSWVVRLRVAHDQAPPNIRSG